VPLIEPAIKRVVAFVDGQNLYRCAKDCFGYHYPNYDVMALSRTVCQQQYGCDPTATRFYTGVAPRSESSLWHDFWQAKLRAMGQQGAHTFTRPTRNGKEKGIDVRIALDVIRMAHRNEYDVAILFSQDQDLSEAANEIRTISVEQQRWIKIACAFPYAEHANSRGINSTDWIRITKATYDLCIDPRDYRPKSARPVASPSPL
jgi:uncharacterized LabA/DUF88 family protein